MYCTYIDIHRTHINKLKYLLFLQNYGIWDIWHTCRNGINIAALWRNYKVHGIARIDRRYRDARCAA